MGEGVVLRTYCPTYHGYTGFHSRLNVEVGERGLDCFPAPSLADPHPHIGRGRRPLGSRDSLSDDRAETRGLDGRGDHVIYRG